jgi:hypothetical protein
MLGNFYGAIVGWSAATAVIALLSQVTTPKPAESLREITYFTGTVTKRSITPATWILVGSILIACTAMNFIFR